MKGDRGSLSIITIVGGLMLCTFALGAADLGALLLARDRAQLAADAAALAAVAEQAPALATTGDPERAARDQATKNSATLQRCDCTPNTSSAHVVVTLHPHLIFVTPWFGKTVRAEATATIDEDVLSYRAPG